MKKFGLILITGILTLGIAMPVFAGKWKKDSRGWWYQNDNGYYIINKWQWIDGNSDGIAECYFFNKDGYLLTNTITPDGSRVNESGAWMVSDVVQIRMNNNVTSFPRGRVENVSYINGTIAFDFSMRGGEIFFSVRSINGDIMLRDRKLTIIDVHTLLYQSEDGAWDIYLSWDPTSTWGEFKVSGKTPYGMGANMPFGNMKRVYP